MPDRPPTRASTRALEIAAIAAAGALLFLLMVRSQAGMSPVIDELVGPAVGYAELTAGDRGFRDVHPPLSRALQALPLLGEEIPRPFDSRACDPRRAPQVCVNEFAIALFYQRAVADPDRLLDRSRRANQTLATLGLVAAGLAALALGGRFAAAVTTLLFFDPLWIAHGRIATNDMPCAVLSFLALIALARFRARGGIPRLVLVGALGGAAFAAKFSALPFLVGIGGTLLADAIVRPARLVDGTLPHPRRAALLRLVLSAAVGLAVLIAAYGGHGLVLVRDFLLFVARMSMGHPAYFLGQISTTGWPLYFPIAFLLKTPLGTLALTLGTLAAGAVLVKRRGARAFWNSWAASFLVPGALFLLLSLKSPVNIGLRYWLPLLPVLFLAVGVLCGRAPRRRIVRPVVLGLLAVNAASMVRAYPHYLAYFNEACGGPARGAEYLSDSNLDWGQDLAALARIVREKQLGRIALAYFGAVPPSAYGIDSQWVYSLFNREPPDQEPPREVPRYLAVSLTIQTGQYMWGLEWLRHKQPMAWAGRSIPVYDITNDADAHRRLAEFYRQIDQPRTAAAHDARAEEIEREAATAPP